MFSIITLIYLSFYLSVFPISIQKTPHSENTKPLDVTVAPFLLLWAEQLTLPSVPERQGTFSVMGSSHWCLNCTAVWKGPIQLLLFRTTTTHSFPSVCNTLKPQQRPEVGVGGLGNYCTLQLLWSRTAYIILHLNLGSCLQGVPQPCQ